MNELSIFIFGLVFVLILQAVVDYCIFGAKKLRIQPGSEWENINTKSPFYKYKVKIVEVKDFQVFVDFEDKMFSQHIYFDDFIKDYKLI